MRGRVACLIDLIIINLIVVEFIYLGFSCAEFDGVFWIRIFELKKKTGGRFELSLVSPSGIPPPTPLQDIDLWPALLIAAAAFARAVLYAWGVGRPRTRRLGGGLG